MKKVRFVKDQPSGFVNRLGGRKVQGWEAAPKVEAEIVECEEEIAAFLVEGELFEYVN